jgi:two-component system, OmpR family, response regulator VicR
MADRILLIEDEKKLAHIIKDTLELYELEVITATDGVEGVKLFAEQSPDLLILDIMMPRLDGFQVLQQVRAIDKKVPVIMLTARSQTIDVVKGFELGCNDYIRKPFSMDELLARVRALLSRSVPAQATGEASGVLSIGKFIFHITAQELRSPSVTHKLSFKETELLKRLWLQSNRVLDRKTVLLELWGDDNIFNSRSLNVYITRLRNYLKEDTGIEIINIRSIGYKLVKK